MLSCREATRLMSQSLDHRLPLGKRVALRFHLAICFLCRRYRRQLGFLETILRVYVETGDEGSVAPEPGLSPEVRLRIVEQLRTANADGE